MLLTGVSKLPLRMTVKMRAIVTTIALVIAIGFSQISDARGKYGKISVEGPLAFELNGVLKATDGLHKACMSQNNKQVDLSIRTLLESLRRASEKSSLAKEQKPHLIKMLDAAAGHLELTLNRSGEDRRSSLKEAFNHLVQIAKIFKLDEYQVFFCPADKAVWMQKGNKPGNPIHPQKYPTCGKLVR